MARRMRAAVAVAGLVALTAACGGGDGTSPFEEPGGGTESESSGGGEGGGDAGSLEGLTPQEISDRAQEALLSADSVRMTMLGDTAAFGMDLHLDRAGSCEGTITQPGMGSVEILMRDGEEVWMKPDSEFWTNGMGTADPALVSLLDGSYLYGSTSDPEMAQMAGACSLDDLFADLGDDSGDEMTAAEGPTEHNGVPVVAITGTDSAGETTTILVAAEGEPYPLLLSGESDGMQMEMELSQFNEPVEFEEPPADLVLDVADFRTGDFASV
ncbi:hypothetical protein [Streptomyces litchfieldiae]|uniref:Lipoprotein n=1 Tax=Streptomyces litchfieldiae TaxID=3075543 RepID=A0ABU2MNJ5_9ACTN|nr:hypothetical protein [Streptomyces sp. DSM 44938]MDT0343181.1 hypothetical protein [Streptomyces sp. DSM 44938]